MAYKYRWLSEALDDMSNEIDYVAKEFGLKTARQVENRVHERVLQLCQFPNSGVRYEEDILYNGQEVRVLHIRQLSLIYSFDNEIITLIAVWNNYQNPDRLNEVINSREKGLCSSRTS
jgi:plasmid stabilization system protein ParE